MFVNFFLFFLKTQIFAKLREREWKNGKPRPHNVEFQNKARESILHDIQLARRLAKKLWKRKCKRQVHNTGRRRDLYGNEKSAKLIGTYHSKDNFFDFRLTRRIFFF